MAFINLDCPHCQQTIRVDTDQLPDGPVVLACPLCSEHMTVDKSALLGTATQAFDPALLSGASTPSSEAPSSSDVPPSPEETHTIEEPGSPLELSSDEPAERSPFEVIPPDPEPVPPAEDEALADASSLDASAPDLAAPEPSPAPPAPQPSSSASMERPTIRGDAPTSNAPPPDEILPPGFTLPEDLCLPSGVAVGGDRNRLDTLRGVLAEHGSDLHPIEDLAILERYDVLPELVVIFASTVAELVDLLKPLEPLPSKKRRRTFCVLVCDEIRTFDGAKAFHWQVDLFLHPDDLEHAAAMLHLALEFKQRLWGPLLEAEDERISA